MGAPRPRPIVLDTGALLAIERGKARMIALLDAVAQKERSLLVPAGVLAQAWRDGSRQVRLQRFLNADAVRVEPLDRPLACACGALCGEAGASDVVDASVAVLAKRHGASVVTSDPDDIGAFGLGLEIFAV
jgi:predicted nucleic acid-binding protein